MDLKRNGCFKTTFYICRTVALRWAEVSVNDIKLAFWKEIFLKTMEEKDREKLARLVSEAELAIFQRQQKLYNCPRHREELSAMCVASEALRVVKHEITKPGVL